MGQAAFPSGPECEERTSMKIGFYYFATEYAMPVVEVARALEERGYESLFVPEHTHIPASRRSPWPGGAELPRQYSHTLDPFVALAAAAAATKSLRLGTGICLLTERDPIVTAKEVATLDLISNGRFEFGIGAGWNAEEMENHSTKFDTRFRVMVDRAKAMQAIWTQDEASYQGEFTAFEPIWSWPKPVQKPHPPILLGGETQYTLRRVMEFCNGWFPRGRSFGDPEAEMRRLRSFAEAAGRDIKTVSTTLFGATPEAGYLAKCQAAGVERALLALPPEGRDAVLPLIDQYTAFLE
jgi:probable F420-dependent oxidoreductase